MGQKINPVLLRLRTTNRHFDSSWYSNYFYKKLITREVFLQNYLNNFLKLLKLPVGRYSIQHLQKKTQVSNFFSYSKRTREWRLKLFGLNNNRFKKTKYFFKETARYKKRNKKLKNLSFFYNKLNQARVAKIKKRITSFQNFQLWSCLFLKKKKMNETMNSFFSKDFFNKKNTPLLIQKINGPNKTKNLKSFPTKKIINNTSFSKRKDNLQNLSIHTKKNWNQITNKQIDNSNLLFFQNLFLYKILKSRLKMKTQSSNRKRNQNRTNTEFINKTSHNFSFSPSFLEKKMNETFLFKKEVCSLQNFQPKMEKNFLERKPSFTPLNLKYKNYLESYLSRFYKLELDLMPFKVKNDWQNASYLADEIVYLLQKRIPFRRLKQKLLNQLSKIDALRGVRITCSGRVGGKSKKAQRSKMECLKYGQTSLQVFSSKIDFSVKTAFTSFGSVGVKVWICYY